VSDDSGRGVGLVTVLERIRDMRGRLHFETEPGRGTQARIEVPSAAATARVLLVRSGPEIFALPLRSVEGVTEASGRPAAPSVRRARLTELVGPAIGIHQDRRRSRAHPTERERRKRDRFALRLPAPLQRGQEREELELIVDDVLRRDLVVVRPLGRRFACPGIDGAALLGDGRLVLVIDAWRLLLARQAPSSERLRLPREEEA
ncbi:MAG TPA: hypothetical protein DEA08_09635, partial [Planctomycetes bacterium]|nr:hypothetical protein [Planctomycetota bacterium]